ncbi:response regulator [Ciceribacter sp. RN22]|uniref:response regulator n=1 Tax=Ciceribacter sp. RN22 TaxID=2954932 RepID=UPI002091EFC5|nr:response regulator [Ciceribacter sp. RN22]MCO6177206.1 response regulator [Ciceribacter sp. RN22]
MASLLLNAEFWNALSNFAWPAMAAFLLIKFHPLFASLLKRENMQIKVGNLELSVQEAAKHNGADIADLQQRIAIIEANISNEKDIIVNSAEYQNSKKSKSILWVDDFPSNNAFMIEKLKEKGIEVVLSIGTNDALAKIEYNEFRAIITDLGRIEDGVDNPNAGFDLLARLKALGKEIPVLVFAGRRALQNRAALLEAGAENATNSGVDVLAFVERHLGAL